MRPAGASFRSPGLIKRPVWGSGLQREFAKLAEQREVQRRPHLLLTQCRRQRRVAPQLRPVALQLLADELLDAAALVPAGLEVDDPALAVLVEQHAIDYDIHDATFMQPAEAPFAVGVAGRAGE